MSALAEALSCAVTWHRAELSGGDLACVLLLLVSLIGTVLLLRSISGILRTPRR
jgi:hypothetical protein